MGVLLIMSGIFMSRHERTRSRAERPRVEGSGRVKVGVRSLSVVVRLLCMPPPVEIMPGKDGGIPISLRSACSAHAISGELGTRRDDGRPFTKVAA